MTRKQIHSASTRRGRPPTFTPEIRRHLAGLIAKHGASRTRDVSPVPIAVATLLKIAAEFGIPLPKGRRPRARKTGVD